MTATTYGADGKPANAWRFSALNERGGLVPMVVASKLARPAVWAAFGGNRNIPLQRFRIDQPLTPPDKIYDYGTHGHAPNANAPEGCELYGHKDLLSAIKQRPRAEILGSADLVAITDPEELLVGMLPEDPEHVGFPRTVETELRVLIRGADFDTLGPISPYTYEPLAA
jgi:hypothetical protein